MSTTQQPGMQKETRQITVTAYRDKAGNPRVNSVMTKCIVLGGEKINQEKKPIEFIKRLNAVFGVNDSKRIENANIIPRNFKYIELVCPRRANYPEYDIMFAYDDSLPRQAA